MIFSKMHAYKQHNFGVIKNGIYAVNLQKNSTRSRFQNNIFTFGCAMVKKTGKGDDATYLKCNFWHF